MKYIELKSQFRNFTVFSINDIRKLDSCFHQRRLYEWQEKGYIIKVCKGHYIFADQPLNEPVLFEIANRIYAPSYISLEMAMSYYGFIPESVYGVTSVSTRKTCRVAAPFAKFIYRSIRETLFFGYELISYRDKVFKIAAPEKAVLDYLYLHPDLKTADDFKSLRFNKTQFQSLIKEDKWRQYRKGFKQKTFSKRARNFFEYINHA